MERIRESKILKILGVLIVSIVILLVTRITYAFLAPVVSEGKNVDISGEADLVDDFKLEVGDALVLNATPTTLPENGNNYVSSTKATAKLRANSTNNSVTKNYYLYLQLADNTFEHIKEGSPEILLSITNPNGEAVTSLGDLTYGTFNGVSGFDVTEADGIFTIASNYEISSTSSSEYTTQEWTIKLTYLNQNFDQSSNYGKSLKTTIYFQKEERPITLAEWVIEQYGTQTSGNETIYLHNSSLENGAGDNSYRYAGANPNNYVCFGTDEVTCPDDNLYRIIGVFENQTKLIKASKATDTLLGTGGTFYYGDVYSWSSTNNSWSSSALNTINLNDYYLNTYLSNTWSSKIVETSWKVSGISSLSDTTPKGVYSEEIENAGDNNYNAKIGLMYISDYGFSTLPSAWASNMFNYNSDALSNNWLYNSNYEWTITKYSNSTSTVFFIHRDGYIGSYASEQTGCSLENVCYENEVRPVFYLNSDITVLGIHAGTSADPIRIN